MLQLHTCPVARHHTTHYGRVSPIGYVIILITFNKMSSVLSNFYLILRIAYTLRIMQDCFLVGAGGRTRSEPRERNSDCYSIKQPRLAACCSVTTAFSGLLQLSQSRQQKVRVRAWRKNALYTCRGRLVPVVGLEPTRMISPQDFESSASASFTTPARLLLYHNRIRCATDFFVMRRKF